MSCLSDIHELCRYFYELRKEPWVRGLLPRSNSTATNYTSSPLDESLANIRHYVGRLGSHLRAARTLVAAARKMPALFDDWKLRPLTCPPPSPPPKPDNLKTLEAILFRMLPKDDPEKSTYLASLQHLDQRFHLLDRMKQQYEDHNFKPRVHAELLILEHFYHNKLDFYERDKYIGCSKPACYCCYEYIRAHLGNFVQPASHKKIYLNWAAPDSPVDSEGAMIHRRDMLIKMVVPIRQAVLEQIRQRRGPSKWHPDSTTGITESVAGLPYENPLCILEASDFRHVTEHPLADTSSLPGAWPEDVESSSSSFAGGRSEGDSSPTPAVKFDSRSVESMHATDPDETTRRPHSLESRYSSSSSSNPAIDDNSSNSPLLSLDYVPTTASEEPRRIEECNTAFNRIFQKTDHKQSELEPTAPFPTKHAESDFDDLLNSEEEEDEDDDGGVCI